MKEHLAGSHFFCRLLPLVVVLALPSLANAHPLPAGSGSGLLQGIAHPLSGLDHFCAMTAVGLWVAQRGGRAIWLVPVSFLSVMCLGAVVGRVGVAIPHVEAAIAASVLVVGILIALSVRLPVSVCAGIVAVFALFHGHSHGTEVPALVSPIAWGAGFMLSTATVLAFGVAAGCTAQWLNTNRLIRLAGGIVAVCGVFLCI